MSRSRRAVLRVAAAVVSVAILVVLGLAVFLNLPHKEEPEQPDTPKRRGMGFHEAAEEVGITFKMTFLSEEQGKNFKGNLYDHGCGVAIADFEGSGHEGIYFTNQFGRN